MNVLCSVIYVWLFMERGLRGREEERVFIHKQWVSELCKAKKQKGRSLVSGLWPLAVQGMACPMEE